MRGLPRFDTEIPVNSLARLIKQVYFPLRGDKGWSLEAFLKQGDIRYFSYGRYALREALIIIGIQKGDAVLMPAFICRELLAAINSLGACPMFYTVGKDLGMAEHPEGLPDARAILAVNYFGFPQDLAPFKAYCTRTGAVLIEDNAHGLLSCDELGQPLGTRGDLGIFSLRKTVALPNGAALILNFAQDRIKLSPQEPFSHQPLARSFRVKQLLRTLSPVLGWRSARLFTSLGRWLRKIRTGHEIVPSPPDAEFQLPENALPCKELIDTLASLDAEGEARRRRELYLALEETIKGAGGEPVFERLPLHVVPYVFPYYASDEQAITVKKTLEKLGLECHRWPELPDAVMHQAPDNYKAVWMVSFIW